MLTKALSVVALGMMLVAAKDDPLAGRVAGPASQCLSGFDTNARAEIVDARTIVYSRTDRRNWVVHPQGVCQGLRPGRTLVVEQRGAQLCKGDRFRTVQSTSSVPSAYCTFDSFIPYDRSTAH